MSFMQIGDSEEQEFFTEYGTFEQRKQEFLNKMFLYTNQLIGDKNFRTYLYKDFFKFKKNPLIVDILAVDPISGHNWTHHKTYDFNTGKQVCSIEQGAQCLRTSQFDTMCQSYSLYNMFVYNYNLITLKHGIRQYPALKDINNFHELDDGLDRNTGRPICINFRTVFYENEGITMMIFNNKRLDAIKFNATNVANFLIEILSDRAIQKYINKFEFPNIKVPNDKNTKVSLLSDEKGKFVEKIDKKTIEVLEEWKTVGYMYLAGIDGLYYNFKNSS